MLQRALNEAATEISLRAPTVATRALLIMVLGLDFYFASKDDLSSGLHDFMLGQHTAVSQNI